MKNNSLTKINIFNSIHRIPGLLLISGLLVSGLMTSCKKFIQIPANPPNQIAQADVFSDSTSVMSALAGVYSYAGNGFAFYDGSLPSCTGLSSDELSATITYNSVDIPQLYNNAILSDNSFMGTFWTNIYSALYKVNVCLEGIGSSTGISPALKQQLLGEMEVTRALYYFNLVNLFGGVPLVTSTDYQATAFLPGSTVDQVYALIIADLSDAQTKLKPAYPSAGRARPNQYTAMALLARVYLYRGQWQEALNMANSVIGSGTYQLEPDLNNVFLHGSNEAIWQLPATSDYYQTQEAFNFVPSYAGAIPNYIVTSHLINAFEPGDQRLQNWVGVATANVNGVDQFYNYPYKYKNASAVGAPTIEDYMVFRLAELYLIRAEANAQLNDMSDARTDLDQVRSRAVLPNSAAATQPDMLTAIMHERQTELFCEWGNRWYDLKRTGTIDAVLGAEKPGWQPYAALYPIPYLEVRNNVHLVQNPGYH